MKFRRRKYITSAGFQWKMVLPFVIVSLFVSIVSNVVFNVIATRRLDALRWSIHLDESTINGFLKPLFISVNLVAIASVALLLVVTGFWMMERVKGPLYRISRELARIREGNLEGPINLRGKDEFKDVAEALNGMLDGMRERAFDFKRDFNNISRDIEKLKTERATGKPIIDDASRIAGKVAKLRERLEL